MLLVTTLAWFDSRFKNH